MTRLRTAAVIALLAAFAALTLAVHAASAQEHAELTWTKAERGDITLWHSQGEVRADVLADHAQGAYDLVSDLIDVDTPTDLAIVVWPADADSSDASLLPDDLDRGDELLNIASSASGAVRNEVTNALINAATGPHAGAVPFWMRAALGFWSQGPLPGFYLQRAGSVVIFDHEEYYTVEQLETVPSTWQFQAKYFGQAGGMLAWFIQDWGPDALAELFRAVGRGVPFYDAIEQVYGIPEARLISEFTKNAERALLLLWPYIEPQSPPFYERLNINHLMIIAVSIPGAILLFFIGKRLFYD